MPAKTPLDAEDLNVSTLSHVSVLQRQIVPSRDLEANSLLSCEKETPVIAPVCHSSVLRGTISGFSCHMKRQIRMVRSSEPDAMYWPSGDQARLYIADLCSLRISNEGIMDPGIWTGKGPEIRYTKA